MSYTSPRKALKEKASFATRKSAEVFRLTTQLRYELKLATLRNEKSVVVRAELTPAQQRSPVITQN